jgi:putative transposase
VASRAFDRDLQIVDDLGADVFFALHNLVRDRDGIYGDWFRQKIKGMGIREIIISRQSPWQNPYVERAIGSVRRECLDHMIVLDERHLRLILKRHIAYYHGVRPHLSLQQNAPVPSNVESARGRVIGISHLDGLHHHYQRAA